MCKRERYWNSELFNWLVWRIASFCQGYRHTHSHTYIPTHWRNVTSELLTAAVHTWPSSSPNQRFFTHSQFAVPLPALCRCCCCTSCPARFHSVFFHRRCHSNIHPQAPTGDFGCALLITPLHLREIKCPEGGVGVSKCACLPLQWNISEQIVWLGCLQSRYVMRASHWFIYLFFYTQTGASTWRDWVWRLLAASHFPKVAPSHGELISFHESRAPQTDAHSRTKCCKTPAELRKAEWIPNICQFITAVLHHVIGPPLLEKKKTVPFPVHISGAPWNNYFQICSLPSTSATLFWFSD